jgi:hypothetical protein
MFVNLIIGDYSGDGHKQMETITIESNLTILEINEAYNKGIEKLGFDFVAECFAEFEDHSIDDSKYRKLIELGMPPDLINEYLETDSNEEYLFIYLFIVKLGNPEFIYSEVNIPKINVGGYGLFYL